MSIDTAVEDKRQGIAVAIFAIRLLEQGYASSGYLSCEYFQRKSSACLCLHPALANWHLHITETQKWWLERISGGF